MPAAVAAADSSLWVPDEDMGGVLGEVAADEEPAVADVGVAVAAVAGPMGPQPLPAAACWAPPAVGQVTRLPGGVPYLRVGEVQPDVQQVGASVEAGGTMQAVRLVQVRTVQVEGVGRGGEEDVLYAELAMVQHVQSSGMQLDMGTTVADTQVRTLQGDKEGGRG